MIQRRSREHTIFTVATILLLAAVVSASLQDKKPKAFPHVPRPFFLSHRGSRFLAPENTIGAFKSVLGMGGGILEFDIRLTTDEQLVVYHDEYVNRTTNGEGKVIDFTLEEIRKLDAAYKFADSDGNFPSRGKGIVVPTLTEVLEEFWGKPRTLTKTDVNMNIEIKDADNLAAELLYLMLAKYPKSEEHVVVVSNFCGPLEILHKLSVNHPIPTGACEKSATRFVLYHKMNDLTRPLFELGKLVYGEESILSDVHSAYQIPVEISGLDLSTPELIREAHHVGKETHYWVVNSKSKMIELLTHGKTDAIITDRTDVAIQVWKELNLPMPKLEKAKQHYQQHASEIIIPPIIFEEGHTCVTVLCKALAHLKLVLVFTLIISIAVSCQICWYCCAGPLMILGSTRKLKKD